MLYYDRIHNQILFIYFSLIAKCYFKNKLSVISGEKEREREGEGKTERLKYTYHYVVQAFVSMAMQATFAIFRRDVELPAASSLTMALASTTHHMML